MKKKFILLGLFCLLILPAKLLAQTIDDLGDSASFGKETKFFGSAYTGAVYLDTICSPIDLGMTTGDVCGLINATTNAVSYDYRDLGTITFPANTFQNVIYPLVRNSISYNMFNNTTTNKNMSFNYKPYITLESDYLNDPTLINSITNQPFGGKLDITLPGSKLVGSTLVPNGIVNENENFGAFFTNGITKKVLTDSYGVPPVIADKIFSDKIKIRLNIKGNARYISFGYAFYTIRFLGN